MNEADDNGVCGSDSDSTLSDDLPGYYQPISTLENGGLEDGDEDQDPNPNFHNLMNGLSYLDLSDDGVNENDDGEEEETAEATESERAIEPEDERRRSAPLTTENAVRVMEAMRRVSFSGTVPEWAVQVPEDQWIDRLRRLRGPSSN